MFDKEENEIWEQLGKLKTPEPSAKMKPRFYAMLDTFHKEIDTKETRSWTNVLVGLFSYKPAYNWTFAIVILMLGASIGYLIGRPDSQMMSSHQKVETLASEVQEIKRMMVLSMLENPTATERLKAVSYTQELNTVDNQMIEALLTTLNFDSNENVRLVTLEALVALGDNPKVRKGLVQSLLKQESPLVQVALADAMVKLQEKSAVKPFKQLLRKDNLHQVVKTKIEKTIKALS
ncbi:MAG: HEAT repeat domain-containing protein [Spirosomataceae bacterium]